MQMLLAICAFALTASVPSCRVVDRISAIDLTRTRLSVAHNRIEKFWDLHQRVPSCPEELPHEPDRDCLMTDGWGRSLKWSTGGKNVVRVWSLGRDGVSGGKEEDADLEVLLVGDVDKERSASSLADPRTVR